MRHYQERIHDPVLTAQVRDFIRQKAMHTKMHARFNAAIVARYPAMKAADRVGAFLLGLTRRFTPRFWQLGVTCALEHFTAMFADQPLRIQTTFERHAAPSFGQLWLWHAVEETEHKAVCFDVYQAVMGKGALAYVFRVLTMLVTTVLFMLAIEASILAMKRTTAARRPGGPEARPGNAGTRFRRC